MSLRRETRSKWSRRGMLGLLGIGGVASLSGNAAAGTNQVGTIGTQNKRVDLFADTVDANKIAGVSGALQLTKTDSPTTHATTYRADGSFKALYNSTTVDILTGAVYGSDAPKYRITFSDGSTTTVSPGSAKGGTTANSNYYQVTPIPPTTDVVKVEIGGENFEGGVGGFILTV